MLKRRKIRKFNAFEVVVMIFLGILALSYIYMLFWSVISALKDVDDFSDNMFGLPKAFVWDHLSYVVQNLKVPIKNNGGLQYVGIPEMLLNTVVYVLGCGLSSTVVPFVTAYLVTKYPYKFSKILYGVVIFTMILPIVGSTPSSINVLRSIGLYDTFWGVFLLKTPLLRLFSDDYASIRDSSFLYLYICSSTYLFLGVIHLLRNAIQGMGFSAVTMLSGTAELVMRVVAAFVFAGLWGYTGVCFANPAAWFGADVILVVIFVFIYKRHFVPALRRENEKGKAAQELPEQR